MIAMDADRPGIYIDFTAGQGINHLITSYADDLLNDRIHVVDHPLFRFPADQPAIVIVPSVRKSLCHPRQAIMVGHLMEDAGILTIYYQGLWPMAQKSNHY